MTGKQYPDVKVIADVVNFKLIGGKLHVLLHKRPVNSRAYPGAWALPGGFVHADTETTLHDTVKRVMSEKVGVDIGHLFYQQFFTYADATRDPDGWSSSIAHYAISGLDVSESLADDVKYVCVDELPALGFDHQKIIHDALAHVRNKANYSSLPCYFLNKSFSLTELQQMYEFLIGRTLNMPNFRRKIDGYDFLVEVEDTMKIGNHRPAKMYTLRSKNIVMFDKSI